MMNIATTKIYKNFQTSIPKEMREAFNIDEKTGKCTWKDKDDKTCEYTITNP